MPEDHGSGPASRTTVRLDTSAPRRSAPTKPYIMTGRGTFGGFDKDGNRKLYKAGDSVELTESQARSFRDKFKAQEVVEAERRVVEAQAAAMRATQEAQAEADKVKQESTNKALFGDNPPAAHSTEGTQTAGGQPIPGQNPQDPPTIPEARQGQAATNPEPVPGEGPAPKKPVAPGSPDVNTPEVTGKGGNK